MEPERQEESRGHRIELRAREALHARDAEREEELELLIDDRPVPYGQQFIKNLLPIHRGFISDSLRIHRPLLL